MSRFLKAVLLLAGMIIGAGMFGIPFAFAQAGFWVGVGELAILSLAVLGLHLLYGEIVLATPEFHRMPGYIRTYLGRGTEGIAWASTLFGTVGTLLAYLVVGSLFLQNVVETIVPGSGSGAWALWLACAVGLITFFPLKKEAAVNGVLTIFEIGFLIFVSALLMRNVSSGHLSGAHLENLFVPYGVLLFALSGASVIPDVVTVLGRDRMRVRAAIVAGSLIPVLLYFFFALGVVGVSGTMTSVEAVAGLERVSIIGGTITFWLSLAGFLAILTSFIALSANFQQLLALDLSLSRYGAWISASAIPVLLYLMGFQNFITIIGAVGIFAFGVDGILFFLMGRKLQARQRGPRSLPAAAVSYLILALIISGVIAQLVRMIR